MSPTRAKPKRPDTRAVRRAFADLLNALGHAPRADLASTPARAAELWVTHLTMGERQDPRAILSRSASPSRATTPVCVSGLGIYLVCPHHLTVACGTADLAYLPAGSLVGFGALSQLVEACTARLVLQEEATEAIADALSEQLGAAAALVRLRATHPCHNLHHPRAHGAVATTSATRGPRRRVEELERQLARARA